MAGVGWGASACDYDALYGWRGGGGSDTVDRQRHALVWDEQGKNFRLADAMGWSRTYDDWLLVMAVVVGMWTAS